MRCELADFVGAMGSRSRHIFLVSALTLLHVAASPLIAASPESFSSEQHPLGVTLVGPDGQALEGATITAQLQNSQRVTRFSNAYGYIDLTGLELTNAVMTAAYPGLETRSLSSLPPSQIIELEADADFLEHLSSGAWLALLPDGEMKREFIVNCATCHELGFDRIMVDSRTRNASEWLGAIAAMRAMDAYEVIPPDFDDSAYAGWLAEHLSDARIKSLRPSVEARSNDLSAIEIIEYPLPEQDSLPHDLVIGPDGRIWITAFFYDELWALEPETGEVQRYSVDTRDNVNAQPRALEFDDQDRLWLVNGGTESVLRFDIETGSYIELDVGMYAHSIDLGPTGRVWINDYFAAEERVAVVDPRDNSVESIPVSRAGRPLTEGLPLPYGLQVDSRERVYSTQLAANTLVRYDPENNTSTLWQMPVANSGPRRPGLDSNDGLWIPEFNTGYVAFFDPEREGFERFRFGSSSTGLYDVEVNQLTNDVWATGSLDSTLIRYRPSTGDILTVPLPTEPAYTRHIAIDEATGDVWTAYSSLPAAKPRIARLRMLK
jgi:streptogramin lyase